MAAPSSIQQLRQRTREFLQSGRYPQAEEAARRLLATHAADAEAYFFLAASVHFQGRSEQAFALASQALALSPDHPQLHNLIAQIYIGQNRLDDALASAQRAVAADPTDGMSHNTLGAIHILRERSELALAPLQNAVRLSPGDSSAVNNLARALADHAMVEEASMMLDRALLREPGNPALLGSYTPLLNYPAGAAPRVRMAAASATASIYTARAQGRTLCAVRDFRPERPLRIGLLSTDFRRHSCAYFLHPLLRHFPRDQGTLHAFICNTQRDDITQRLESVCDSARDVSKLSALEVAQTIARERIDILLELGGYTSGSRLEVCAFSPAAAHAAYLAYPATTALPQVGWRIVDAVTDPVDRPDLFTERSIRMDGCFLCYDPLDNLIDPRPATPDRPLTFGSFSATPKVCRATTDLWAKVLRAVPDSRLLLKGWTLGSDVAQDVLRKRFVAHGVPGDRLEFAPRNRGSHEHLRTYDQIDIALDTTPYAGTTTTCEALLMGVPVVTLAGDEHRSRVGASLLGAVGMQELVADSHEQYVQICQDLAGDKDRRTRLHGELRARLLASQLCDGQGFAQRFAAALRTIWRDRCAMAKGA